MVEENFNEKVKGEWRCGEGVERRGQGELWLEGRGGEGGPSASTLSEVEASEVLGREGWGLGICSGGPCTLYMHTASDLGP